MPSFLNPATGTFFAPDTVSRVSTPVAGGTVTMSSISPSVYLTPAATLATLTIKLPPNPKPGATATISSTQAVTTLTLQTATGGAVAGAPTALVANTAVRMSYINSTIGWAWVK